MPNTSNLKIAIAQMNPILGDLAGNCQKILELAKKAQHLGVDLLITPELSLTGYPPEDLLFRNAFIDSVSTHLKKLMIELAFADKLTVIVGHPQRRDLDPNDQGLFNMASVIKNGRVIASYAKQKLPNNEVFDEVRYFQPGKEDKAQCH